MQKNLIAFCLMILLLFSVSAPCFGAVLNVRAYIDGRSRLIIQGSDVWWHHLEYAAPGRHAGADYPTYLNSTAWLPTWPSLGENSFCNCPSSHYTNLSPELATNGADIEITEISVRDDVFVYQQPSGANEYTAIVEFYDGAGGAAWYEINITYSGKDQASIPTLSEWGMIFMSLMMAGTAIWRMRRRQAS